MAFFQTPRRVVASLISTIPKPLDPHAASANPLTDVPEVKQRLLTLHVLFPNELLPALDLLDRGLVTRLRPMQAGHSSATNEEQAHMETYPAHAGLDSEHAIPTSDTVADQTVQQPGGPHLPCTYYVRSAQQQTSRSNSRYRNAAYENITYYEARLEAWSCSCPAFAFSAFPAASADVHKTAPPVRDFQAEGPIPPNWVLGGLSLGSDMPICKHLLACVLVEHSTMFAHFVEERAISLEELAGWAAGWGD
ncbi:hypothetical protein LTR36_000227 [Oleoguttula mirabilis]|uniref:SWIM-type domain-containing protein n=1 Tax=Oleoguttula mirabilis TaxID=1507867 RepID=A0AAV9JXY3_9PEZI|nr:hypothetical protein LTR36_000227 [Oleoguttula mirabilis]